MNNHHHVFRDRIQAWLSCELDAETLRQVESHLAACPECSRQAAAEKEFWALLGEGDLRAAGPAPSIWPQVREQTFGSGETGAWFFGGGLLLRTALAAGAVAAGLMVGVLVPGLSGTATADNAEDGLWGSEASWLDDSATDGLAGIWLDPGLAEEGGGS